MDELGLVSGDRLYVLCSQEDRGQASINSPTPTGDTHSGQIGEETSRTCSRLTEDSVCVEKPEPEADSLVEQELVVDGTSGAVVHYSHLVELLTGERAVDSSCTNGDLLCFALHMIMRDSGYQPTVSHTHSLSLSLTHSRSHTHSHTCTHTHTHSLSLTHSLSHTHTNTLSLSLTHSHPPTYSLSFTHSHPPTYSLSLTLSLQAAVSLTSSSYHSFSYSLSLCPSVSITMTCFSMGPTLVTHSKSCVWYCLHLDI